MFLVACRQRTHALGRFSGNVATTILGLFFFLLFFSGSHTLFTEELFQGCTILHGLTEWLTDWLKQSKNEMLMHPKRGHDKQLSLFIFHFLSLIAPHELWHIMMAYHDLILRTQVLSWPYFCSKDLRWLLITKYDLICPHITSLNLKWPFMTWPDMSRYFKTCHDMSWLVFLGHIILNAL